MSEALIDLAALLAPLADGDGGGQDPREDFAHDSPYRRLKDARSEARDEERARDVEGDDSGAVATGWNRVRQIAQDILSNRAKDIEVASYLTEALVRQHGLAGLVAGTSLIQGLVENFWDTAFPLPDPDGIEDRGIFIGGLAGPKDDGTIMQPLRRTVLFMRADNSPLNLYRFEQSEDAAGQPDEEVRERRYAAGVLQLDSLRIEAKAAVPRLRAVGAEAAGALDAWKALDQVLMARFPDEVPTSGVSRLLSRLQEVTDQLAGGPVPEAAAEEGMPEQGQMEGSGNVAQGGGGGGTTGFSMADPSRAIASREQALVALERIADYFEATEPHSPLAYTLRDAARRGRMSLPDLLAEVLGDESTRHQMLSALGIRPTYPE